MSENLEVSVFRNGDLIPEAQKDSEWKNAGDSGKPAWCHYKNNPANGKKYGKLYNWYAVNDSRGLAPEGWHIPSDTEWTELINYLRENAGSKMKMQVDGM
ncbi:MAG: fibrobacter succinogenes major paralogous domain-containing protein [Ignavibacteria bacterium]|nr:fibrobacter succinogenes major paralogous domain-containing protein [Ignavibacteria bacterium]